LAYWAWSHSSCSVLLLLAAVLGMGMGGVKFTLAAGLSSAAPQEMMDEQSLVP
jgi:hypothetical protein